MSLLKFEFELEFLTPGFIGGTYPADKAEFNLKPLKGLMRYWWRQCQDWSDTEALHSRESRIFGGSEQRSPFSFQATCCYDIGLDDSEDTYRPPGQSGRSYLFYTCIGRGDRQPGRSRWIIDGSRADILLRFTTNDAAMSREVLISLWCAQTFGGLGTRSRRGAGSFRLSLTGSNSGFAQEANDLFSRTAGDLDEAVRGEPPPGDFFRLIAPSSPLAVSMLTNGQFRMVGPRASPNELLDVIGDTMRRHRSSREYRERNRNVLHQQAMAMHVAGQEGAPGKYSGPNPIAKSAFGLPIVFNFKRRVTDPSGRLQLELDSTGKPRFEPWFIVLQPSAHERRASPLFISIKREHGGRLYYANLLALWSEFLPNNETISIIRKFKGQRPDPVELGSISHPSVTAITDFIRSLP